MTTTMRLIEQGKKEGELKWRRNGLKIAVELGLELKFGIEGLKLFERITGIESIERLHVIKEAIKISKNLEEISKLLET